jgi:hypothetical protein
MTTPSDKQSRTRAGDGLPAYEQRLAEDARWALSEGSRHFDEKSAVHDALRKIARRLNELGIPYAVVGGMALFSHGFRRFTEDVDILVTGDDLRRIHKELEGLGYVAPFTGSKDLRDAESGVQIEFLVSGDFPGDGKPKPVAFPDPAECAVQRDGVAYLNLETLVELKLASGMTSPQRMKDLADVQELIKLLGLARDVAQHLTPYVRGKYEELWDASRQGVRRYVRLWPRKSPGADAQTLDELTAGLHGDSVLEAMRADGVRLGPSGAAPEGYYCLVTDDPEVARKYDMHDEAEFLAGGPPAPPGESE